RRQSAGTIQPQSTQSTQRTRKTQRTQRSRHGARRISPEARLLQNPRTGRPRRKEGRAAEVLLRAEASRKPSPLRLPARTQWRSAVVGDPKRAVARPEDKAAGDARRGSPARI